MLKHLLASSLLLLTACSSESDDADAGAPDAGAALDASAPDAGPSGSRALALRFRATVGDQPFACGQSYEGLGLEASTVTPVDLRFYLSNPRLVSAAGVETPVELTQDGVWQFQDVALIDFEDGTGACENGTPATNLALRGTVPAGEYRGLRFTLGVPEALNHQDLIASPAPLDQTALWWSWNLGHIFFAAVTRASVATSTIVNDHYVHVGSTGCDGDPARGEAVSCAKPNRVEIALDDLDPNTDGVTLDLAKVVAGANLYSSKGCHSFGPEAVCGGPFSSLGLSWATGTATATAQVAFGQE